MVIAESSSGDTLEGFDNYKYAQVIPEYKRLNIKLVDLNREQKYEVFTIVDTNIRPTAVRLAKQLQDPDAFIISAAMLKTHDSVVATSSVKNMVTGSPIHNPPTEKRWSDKGLMHAGTIGKFNPHAMNYNLAIVAKHLRPPGALRWSTGSRAWKGTARSTGLLYPCKLRSLRQTSWRRTGWPWRSWGFPRTRWATCSTQRSWAGSVRLIEDRYSRREARDGEEDLQAAPDANDQLQWLNTLVKPA